MASSPFCQSGVNLGGWLSQYPRYDHAHFQSFLSAADVRQIASWGMDHVRLPVDYPVLWDGGQPGSYLESGFEYLERCIEWCKESGLGLVLDLHKAPGYSFAETIAGHRAMPLFEESKVQSRFFELWEAIALRFRGKHPHVVYELLNEVNLPDSGPWNRLLGPAIVRIRAIDPSRTIIVGSNRFGAPADLKELELPRDPNLLCTFHFYEPLLFTHQFAPWLPPAKRFAQRLAYPGPFTNLKAFLAEAPEFESVFGAQSDSHMDRDMLYAAMAPAFQFAKQTGRPLYCGEFGVIERAEPESRRRWCRDVVAILREQQIGRCLWSYKLLDFGLVDERGHVRDAELVSIVSS